MPATERVLVPFGDFSGGDAGRERPKLTDLTCYRGVNVWRYPNGAIGPRPNWNVTPFTGLPTGKSLISFATMIGSSGLWFAWGYSDGTIYTSTPTTPTTAALRGTMATAPTGMLGSTDKVVVYSAAGGGATVSFTGTYTAVVSMPLALGMAEHGEQFVIVQGGSPSVARWSALRDPTSWPSINTVFIGNSGPASAIYALRDLLVVPKYNGEVWVFTGVLGINESLRRVDVGHIHQLFLYVKGDVVGNSVLYYPTGSSITSFDGARLRTFARPDLIETAGWSSDPAMNNVGQVVSLEEPNRFALIGTLDSSTVSGSRLPWMHIFSPEAGWTRHTVPLTAFTVNASVVGTSKDSSGAIKTGRAIEGVVWAVTASDAAGTTTSKIAYLNTRQEFPYLTPSESGQWAITNINLEDGQSGLPVVASVSSAEWWADEGKECQVRGLYIDYTYDADPAAVVGSEVMHTLTASITALQRGEAAEATSTTVTFVPTAGGSLDGGYLRRGRAKLFFGDQGQGGGFRFNFTAWRGIMVHRVTAVVDVMPERF